MHLFDGDTLQSSRSFSHANPLTGNMKRRVQLNNFITSTNLSSHPGPIYQKLAWSPVMQRKSKSKIALAAHPTHFTLFLSDPEGMCLISLSLLNQAALGFGWIVGVVVCRF